MRVCDGVSYLVSEGMVTGGSVAGQGLVFNYEDGDGQPDNTLMLIRS